MRARSSSVPSDLLERVFRRDAHDAFLVLQELREIRYRRAGLLNKLLESIRIFNCEIGKSFSIDLDFGFIETVDKLAVSYTSLPACRTQAYNPEATEVAFSSSANSPLTA